jgi:ABC-type sugar transport system permease subunit
VSRPTSVVAARGAAGRGPAGRTASAAATSPHVRAQRRLFWPFVVPALVLFVIVFIGPIVLSVLYSFGDVGSSGQPLLRNLDHYRHAFGDRVFWSSLKNTLIYSAESTIVLFVPAIFLAWCLAQVRRWRRFFRVVVFAPVVISVLVASLVWKFLLNPTFGPLDVALRGVHLDWLAIPWLGDSRTAMPAVVVAAVWQSLGLWVVLISAGLERIDPDLYEAARVDGAGRWAEFRHISVPQLWPVLRSLILLWIVQAVQVFAFVYIMTGGGPAGETAVVSTYIYDTAFTGQQFGYAAALATIVLVVTGLMGVVVARILRRSSHE